MQQDLSAQLVRGKQAAFQYEPVKSEDLSWLARTENQRNYLESQAKQKEQEDLRDQLIKIQNLGLPKEMQGYLNSEVEGLINKVRAGEIDPSSYDFRAAIAKIGGESNQLATINENLKTAISKDKQIIGEDENGNPVDISDKMRQAYMTGFDTDYTEGADIFGKYGGIQSAFTKAVDPIAFDDQTANTLTNDWIKRNADKYKSISELQQQGYSGYGLITEIAKIDPQAAEDYRTALEKQGSVSLISEYAKAKKAAEAVGIPMEDFETYKKQRLSPYIPKTKQVISQKIDTTRFEQDAAMDRALLRGDSATPPTFELGAGGFTSVFDPATGNIKQYQYLGLDPLNLEDKSGNPYTVLGTTYVDGKKVAITADGIIENSADLATTFDNRTMAKLDKAEKGAYLKKEKEMRSSDNVFESEPDSEKVKVLDDMLKRYGGFNDNEEDFLKEFISTYKVDESNPKNALFLRDFKKVLNNLDNDFDTEAGRKVIIKKALEALAPKFSREFGATSTPSPAPVAYEFDETGKLIKR